ncbi:anhydro-N-acetylmuramic acid kinase [Halorhodospira halochloris]|uniref:Anhydro-N-acetylmuramic acid kinase n=1 Tax=Halorhodospira halochloris TaxID=1052 RepID=A0A0X8X7C1_HALHR|nr:anhydro-N-acetylmuramic acid kinase [Halorhodospira halochloris]MBK1652421.1 anhydro-N-acetylmuramic acid kinase [Halorhodospira halochloris]MCG5547504.1 anhydro-N-acetylmuramic acid kinase [Halorhodospira halochloris]BAU56313.2 anhydro-N-acetylmuramic acid kinase [Halorhodospira halochloris]
MANNNLSGGLYIGLLSGTSIDGVDSALVRLSDQGMVEKTLATATTPFPRGMAEEIRSLGAKTPLERVCEIDYRLADAFAAAATSMLEQAPANEVVTAIGCHGQTIWHNSQSYPPTSVQLGDANRIAAQTGVQVVTDFRRRDIAEGGQGAPLAPAFHKHCLSKPHESKAILNLGGIANITLLPIEAPASTPVSGFDTGPANTLLDAWIRKCHGISYDGGGRWAATGNVDGNLLTRLLEDPYFIQPPPKSTGPEHFSLEWLLKHLDQSFAAEDVQATLVELTAASVAESINRWGGADIDRIYVCGGGAHNQLLMQRLREWCHPTDVTTTASIGIDPDYVEALAFAWLAWARLNHLPGNLPCVTGAHRPAVLGSLYAI